MADTSWSDRPPLGERVGATLAVFTWFAKEHQVAVDGAYRVVERYLEGLCGSLAEWDCACAVIFGI
ncbi:hypothetical protein D3C73_1598650 [compost metagenome]